MAMRAGEDFCLGIGPPVKFSAAPAKVSWSAPVLGEDTVPVLRELGYDENEIQELLESGNAFAAS